MTPVSKAALEDPSLKFEWPVLDDYEGRVDRKSVV